MSTNSALDKFVERLKERLTQLLDQNIDKSKYSIEDQSNSRAFSYKGRNMRNGISIYASAANIINFPLDYFSIMWTSTGEFKSINGQWEYIDYSTIFVKAAFNRTSEKSETYDVPKSQATRLLDVLERLNWVEENTYDGAATYASKMFKIKSPVGEVQTTIMAARNRKDNIELVRCRFPIDWNNKKWKNYLKNSVVEVSLTDPSSWDAAIDEILNTVLTMNTDISKYCKDVVSSTLSAFLEIVKERAKKN